MDKFLKFMEQIKLTTKSLILIIEAILAYALLIMVVLGFLDVGKLIIDIVNGDPFKSYDLVQQVLAHALLLVIGTELAMMLISHSPASVLEVVLYAIAKKMLISSNSTTELLIGSIAIAVIFAIDKYLHTSGNIGSLFSLKGEGIKEEIEKFEEEYGSDSIIK